MRLGILFFPLFLGSFALSPHSNTEIISVHELNQKGDVIDASQAKIACIYLLALDYRLLSCKGQRQRTGHSTTHISGAKNKNTFQNINNDMYWVQKLAIHTELFPISFECTNPFECVK